MRTSPFSKKSQPATSTRWHMLQFTLAGSLHTVCNLRLFASPQSLGAGTLPFGVVVGARAVLPAHWHPGKPVKAATAVARKRKKAPTQCSRRHTLQFALAGSLHAVCNLRLFLRALQALVRSVALPSLCGKGGLRGGEVGVPHSFGREKTAAFRKSRKDFQNKHVHPPPTTSPERNRFASEFYAISKNGCLR